MPFTEELARRNFCTKNPPRKVNNEVIPIHYQNNTRSTRRGGRKPSKSRCAPQDQMFDNVIIKMGFGIIGAVIKHYVFVYNIEKK